MCDWRVPNPMFGVAKDHNSIWGDEWAANAKITIEIDNAPDPFEVDANEWGNFDLWDLDGYDIEVGDIVNVTDGDTVIEHTVTDIQITVIDEATSTLHGTAAPGSEVWVEVHGLGHDELHPRRLVTAKENGDWEANFAEPQEADDCPCFEEIYTFGPGSHGSADELDSEANARTRIHWHSPTLSDVPLDHTFFIEIEALAATGITTGWPDGTFRPTLAVTRQAMAAFLIRALELDDQ